MFKLRHLSLVHQMAITAAVASLCVFAVLIGLTTHLSERAALAKTEEELNSQVRNISRLLELSHANAVADANKALPRFKDSLGPIRVSADNVAAGNYQLPVVRGGDRILNDNVELLDGLRRQIDAGPALLIQQARAAAAFGIGTLHLRERDLDAAALYALAAEVRDVLGAATTLLVNDRADIAAALDAGVHLRESSITSSYEGLGLPPLECMARGLPAVTFDCGGPSVYIRNGENSFIVETASQAANLINELLDDENFRKRIGAAAMSSAENFKNEVGFRKFIDLISS